MDDSTAYAISNAASSLAQIGAGIGQSRAQRRWQEKMADTSWQRSIEGWNMANEYNTPSAQIQRMRDAGLNPMYYGLDGSSADAFEAPLANSYQQAQLPDFVNPIADMMDYKLKQSQLDLVNKQVDKIDADIQNQNEGTEGLKLDNEFKRQTMDARVRGQELANEISKEQKENIMKQRGLIAEQIRKTANEADNEFEKQFLIQAETRLRNASADEIVTLLPYKQLNLEADTLAKKAAAAAASMSALKDKKFIELGGVEAQIEETKARITKLAQDKKTSEAQEQAAKAKAALDAWKNSLQNGTVFNYIIEDPNANEFERELAGFFNGVFNVASMVTSTVGNILPKL